jgi:hypothetical protein
VKTFVLGLAGGFAAVIITRKVGDYMSKAEWWNREPEFPDGEPRSI